MNNNVNLFVVNIVICFYKEALPEKKGEWSREFTKKLV